MSRTVEGNPGALLNRWPFLLDTTSIKSIGIAWLFKEGGAWCFLPRVTGNKSQFYNAVLFLRLSLPFGIFASCRWSAAIDTKALFQCGIGWKLNGRFGLTFRVQSDTSAAAGESGPNYGQATGFTYGTH